MRKMRPRRFHQLAFENCENRLWNPLKKALREYKAYLKTATKNLK